MIETPSVRLLATSSVRRAPASAGFSLLELLVATGCTALLSAAVLSLLVGSATIHRREWGALAARRTASAAVAALARDLESAGAGLEGTAAVRVNGERIAAAGVDAAGNVRLVLAERPAVEIVAHEPGRFVVDELAGMRAGDRVAAVGAPDATPGAPVPVGVIVAARQGGAGVEVTVAWHPAEAAIVAAMGPARALLPVRIRTYSTRPIDGALQLDRSDDGGARQPVMDGLDEVRVEWLVDDDGDGHADALRPTLVGTTPACAARLTAAATPRRGRLDTAPPAGHVPERVVHWVTLGGC